MAVSDLVRASLTNAQGLLKQEKVLNRGRDHTEAVRYDRSDATEVGDDLGEKY